MTQLKDQVVKAHQYHESLPRRNDVQLTVNGSIVDVMDLGKDAFASFEAEGKVEVRLEVVGGVDDMVVSPRSLGIEARSEGNALVFQLDCPQKVLVQKGYLPFLFIYADAPAGGTPAESENVRVFRAGEIYDEGQIWLKSGQACYLEGGAWVRGSIAAQEAEDVAVAGYGVLDGAYERQPGAERRHFIFDHCRNVRVEDVIAVRSAGWNLVLGNSEAIVVRNHKQIAHGGGSDGVDICGSRNVLVENCMLRNGDDNIAIKAIDPANPAPWVKKRYRKPGAPRPRWGSWRGDVLDVVVRNCAFYNDAGGSAMEIGFETRCERIENIRFENIDVMGVHDFGSVFGIHHGDEAKVRNVVWDNVRVEHCYDRLVDLQVLDSRWNYDVRGHVGDVVLRNIDVRYLPENGGYTHSMIGGTDADHTVDGVRIENFRIDGRKVLNADHLNLFTRHARNVSFK